MPRSPERNDEIAPESAAKISMGIGAAYTREP